MNTENEFVTAASSTAFDFSKKTVTLNNGMEMPIIGAGTFGLTSENAENSVYHVLLGGHRLIDNRKSFSNVRGYQNSDFDHDA